MDKGFNIGKFLKKAAVGACVWFTVITAIYSLIVLVIYVDDDEVLLKAGRVLLFFAFSLVFSLANGVLELRTLPMWSKTIIHFSLTVTAFYLCLMLPTKPSASNTLVGLCVFTLIYIIGFAVSATVRVRYKSQNESDVPYKEQYKK